MKVTLDIFCTLILLACVLNGLRLRSTVKKIDTIYLGQSQKNARTPAELRIISCRGDLSEPEVCNLSDHVLANGNQVADLIPEKISTLEALDLVRSLSFNQNSPLSKGVSAHFAVAVNEDTLKRAGLGEVDRVDALNCELVMARLKKFSPYKTNYLIVKGKSSKRMSLAERKEVFNARLGPASGLRTYGSFVPLISMILFFAADPFFGLLPIVGFAILPSITFLGSKLRPKGLVISSILRPFIPIVSLFITPKVRSKESYASQLSAPVDRDELKMQYRELLSDGTDRFFEKKVSTCPMCHAANVKDVVKSRDLLQNKPGKFTVSKCLACGHYFQNPRLSIEGLNFYYKDFYEGMWEDWSSQLFSISDYSYLQRVKMLPLEMKVTKWLDVGAGHGHFGLVAKTLREDCCFDGIDLSESINEAKKRGWLANSYLGLFPELAGSLPTEYEVVSMFHYLEHTRDPIVEISAAYKSLSSGGYFLIENPNPSCGTARILGQYWMPWFQPQHQHMMPMENLVEEVKQAGFEIVSASTVSTGMMLDISTALLLFLNHLAPPPTLPWINRQATWAKVKRSCAGIMAVALLPLTFVLDQFLALVTSKVWRAGAYRVVAKKP